MDNILVYIEPRPTKTNPYPISRLNESLSRYFTEHKLWHVHVGDEVNIVDAETIILKKKTYDTISEKLCYWFRYINE